MAQFPPRHPNPDPYNPRKRILRTLRGILSSCVQSDDPNWLWNNEVGDKLPPEELAAAKAEARQIFQELEALEKVRLEPVDG